MNLADELRSEAYCEKISPYAYGVAGWGAPGIKAFLIRSDCYYNLVANYNDESLCDKVLSISTWLQNGSKQNEATCRARVQELISKRSNLHTGATSIRSEDQVSILSDLGYDYKNDPVYTESMNEYSDPVVALGTYWSSVFATDDFLERLGQVR